MDLNAEDDHISFVSSHSLIGGGGGGGGTNSQAHRSSDKNNKSASASTKQRIVSLANDLLVTCDADPNNRRHLLANLPADSVSSARVHIPNVIVSTRQLTSTVLVYFFESICDSELVDKKWPPRCAEDEVHNAQSVIDSISLDILHEDLSHLTGEAVCGTTDSRPDLVSLEYLLDILRCIHEWIASRIESENCSMLRSAHRDEDMYSSGNSSSLADNAHADDQRHLATITNTVRTTNGPTMNNGSSNQAAFSHYSNKHDVRSNNQQSYKELSRQFEQVVRVNHHQDGMAELEIEDEDEENDSRLIDLEDLIETVNARGNQRSIKTNDGSQRARTSEVDSGGNDVFKKYMEQKEREFRASRATIGSNNSASHTPRNMETLDQYGEEEENESRTISHAG
jgi:hypothetical protein